MTSDPNKFIKADDNYETIKDLYIISAYSKDNNNICQSHFKNKSLDSPTLIMKSLIECLSDKENIFYTNPKLACHRARTKCSFAIL